MEQPEFKERRKKAEFIMSIIRTVAAIIAATVLIWSHLRK